MSSGKEVPIIPLTIQPEKSLPSPPKNPILEKSAFVSAPTSAFEDNTKEKEKGTDKKPDEFSEVGTKATKSFGGTCNEAYQIAKHSRKLNAANRKLDAKLFIDLNSIVVPLLIPPSS